MRFQIRKVSLPIKLSFVGITVALFMWNVSRMMSTDKEVRVTYAQQLIRSATSSQRKPKMFTNIPDFPLSNDNVSSTQRDGNKFLIAFSYWEQVTEATNNLIQLTALAKHGGRRVVIPFVTNSKFYGTMINEQTPTLSLYYNVSQLNRKLQFAGHGSLVSWKEFRDVCKNTLDVLVHFHYSDREAGVDTKAVLPCRAPQTSVFNVFKVDTRTCIYAPALHSVETFETEIAKRQPCVGIVQWRGNIYPGRSIRAQFNFTSIVAHPFFKYFRTDDFFNVKLKHIAQDFIARNLQPDFISVHIRAEAILFLGRGDFKLLTKCIGELSSRVGMMANALGYKVYLATDFSSFGSSSRPANLRNNAKKFMEILANNFNPILFQPADYSLSDHGAIAIVEINVLAAGKRLFVLGGGTYQGWIIERFLNQNSNDLTLMNSTCQLKPLGRPDD